VNNGDGRPDVTRAFARAVGHVLRVQRQRWDWTLAEVGERVGLSVSVLCRTELGVRPLDVSRLVGLCAVLGVAPAQVIALAQAEAFPWGWPEDPVSVRSELDPGGADAETEDGDNNDNGVTNVDATWDEDPLCGPEAKCRDCTPRMTDTAVRVLAVMLADPSSERFGRQIAREAGIRRPERAYIVLGQFFLAGWTSERAQAKDPGRKTPKRRYYRLTPAGVIAARAALAEAGICLSLP